MTELLDEFEEKREALRNIVEEHVRNRDRLSEESQKFAAERDLLNAKVRELRDAAKEKIAEKSALIEQVQKLRAEKEEHYSKYQDFRKEYRKVRGEVPVKDIDIRDIKGRERELQRLETKQQTTQLTKTEEQKVVSEIRKLTNEIKKMKKVFEDTIGQNDIIKDIVQKMKKEKDEGETMKKQVEEISQKISGLSEEINVLLQELDETRKKADEFHELFIKSANNEKLHEMINSLVKKFQRLRVASLSKPGRMHVSVDEHEKIIEAFRNKDATLAEKLVRKNAEYGGIVLMQSSTGSPPLKPAEKTASRHLDL